MKTPARILIVGAFALWMGPWGHSNAQVPAPPDAKPGPQLKVETLGIPVVTSRMFTWALAPNTRGGWTFIGEFMNFRRTNKAKHKVDLGNGRFYLAYDDLKERPEAEWLVADLQAGTYKISNWPGFHVGSNSGCRVLAENGRVFFGVDYAQVHYYDPAEDTIKTLGTVKNDIVELRCFYQMILGPDGMVYAASQSTNGRATIMRLNPDTLEYKLYEKIGLPGRRKDLTYGYTLAADPPWMYVAVGQGNWELFAVNADTGETKCLADVQGEKCRVEVSQGKDVCTASVNGGEKNEKFWLVDGKALPMVAGQTPPGTPMSQKKYAHVEWKNTKPMDVSQPPELDKERWVEADGRGEGEIFWRPAGSTGEYKSLKFAIKNAEPVRIESLIALPDGSLLGNTDSYNGFFRYFPADRKLDYYGKHGPSGVQSVVAEGKVWFDGYPNVHLYAYDPAQPWTSKPNNPKDAKVNPEVIGSFGQGITEAHHCRFLLAPGNGRIYICGHRERWSTGTGLGWYEIATGKKFGLGQANKKVEPEGFIALPRLGRLVLSVQTLGKGDAQLIVYDMDLNEVERLTLKPGLTNTGRIFNGDDDGKFLGCFENPGPNDAEAKSHTLYLYDLAAKKIERSVTLPCDAMVFRRPKDGSFWIKLANGLLARLDPRTLELRPVGQLERKFSFPTWQGADLYGACGGELVRVVGVK
ncbi:MAG: hypothetical protein IT578_01675 [Verrucomicrobiae bacterium]|nr:hypothetical protein [Verrucomicrobiae bacterium]